MHSKQNYPSPIHLLMFISVRRTICARKQLFFQGKSKKEKTWSMYFKSPAVLSHKQKVVASTWSCGTVILQHSWQMWLRGKAEGFIHLTSFQSKADIGGTWSTYREASVECLLKASLMSLIFCLFIDLNLSHTCSIWQSFIYHGSACSPFLIFSFWEGDFLQTVCSSLELFSCLKTIK